LSVVVDASVAIKWIVAEEGHPEALRLSERQPLIAPDWVLAESANVLWKKVRQGQLEGAQARLGLDFIRSAYAELVPSSELLDRALAIALEADHPVYDCLYVACSEQRDAELVTADTRLAGRFAGRLAFRITPLSSLAAKG
jgi:predicted nucleic acid-binding protein